VVVTDGRINGRLLACAAMLDIHARLARAAEASEYSGGTGADGTRERRRTAGTCLLWAQRNRADLHGYRFDAQLSRVRLFSWWQQIKAVPNGRGLPLKRTWRAAGDEALNRQRRDIFDYQQQYGGWDSRNCERRAAGALTRRDFPLVSVAPDPFNTGEICVGIVPCC